MRHRLLRARVCACTVWGMETIVATGVNGTVEFDGSVLTIRRDGVLARMTQGRGVKQVPLGAVGAVQLRPPSMFANGVWSVSVLGEVQSSRNARGVRAVSKVAREDENSVVVGRSQVRDFEALGAAIAAARASSV